MTPRRYQRKRTVTDDIPVDAVYVGRPTYWGNPYRVEEYGRLEAIEAYRADVMDALGHCSGTIDIQVVEKLTELRGKDLVCWCPLTQPCHADVLLELANGIQERSIH